MKAPLTRFYCMAKECDFEETTHKLKEGIKCPKCKGPVMSQEVKKDSKALSIQVDMDTDKMQLKLRAIAKHVSALADELDNIDNDVEGSYQK